MIKVWHLTKLLALFFGLAALACASLSQAVQPRPRDATAQTSSSIRFGVLASEIGAALNTDLQSGGGTDDTAVLQSILNRAENGAPVHLVIDGAALVSGLNVYSNTSIECINGGGLYLKDRSSRAIIRNVHRSRDAIQDERIGVRGCFLNGNHWNQPTAMLTGPWSDGGTFPSNTEADGTYLTGLQFLGVNDLSIENVTLWGIRAFGILISNANRIDIKSVVVDYGAAPGDRRDYGNTDGLHFNGPLRYLTIDGVKVRSADDALALNANDSDTDDLTIRNEFGPYVGQGPITDVTVNNVQLMDAIWGIRLLSSKERIDRVTITDVTGSVKGAYVVNISHFSNLKSLGNFGSIVVSNINADRTMPTPWLAKQLKEWAKIPGVNNELNGGVLPFISVNASVENLSLQDVQTTISDARPILRFGPDANVKMMTADLRLYDPNLQATPIELDMGSRIDSLNLSLFWRGTLIDLGKQPISFLGGSIGRLNWINTPPMYVSSHLEKGNLLAVTFTQEVKAADFKAGVTIKVNGRPCYIVSAARQRKADTTNYVLKGSISPSDTITWDYQAARGNIENLSGGQLLSVSAKRAASQ